MIREGLRKNQLISFFKYVIPLKLIEDLTEREMRGQHMIYEENEKLRWTEERESLVEMANIPSKYTGISGVIYISTKDELTNQQAHSLGRVKLWKAGKSAFCTIKKSKDGRRLASGDDDLIKDLERFVDKNENLLWEYWNTSREEADPPELMKRLVKV